MNRVSDITAVLLCGGKGTRLRPVTDHLPKTLVPIGGRPLLAHLMKQLSDGGISNFVVCVGYMSDQVVRFLEESREPDWNVDVVDSGEAASITDRLYDARDHVPGRALVCYGDTIANVPLGSLVEGHEREGAIASVAVYPLHCPFGIVDVDAEDRVSGFREKPVLPHWINIGYLLCEPAALNLLNRGSDVPEWLEALAKTSRLHAFKHTGRHLTVNTEKDREAAEMDIVDLFTVMEEWTKW